MTMHARVLATLIALLCAPICHATLITYSSANVAGTTWRYDYTLTNDTLSVPIYEFTIFFDRALYENLSVVASPAGWDSIAIQPDLNLPDDGFFDSLALSTGVDVGATLSGFSVRFDWFGIGTPGAQAFDIVDPISFVALESGATSLFVESPPTSVPEPSTLTLLGLGVMGLALRRRARIRR